MPRTGTIVRYGLMGTFDSVHTGTRCGQTKALGSALRDLVPGDCVCLWVNDSTGARTGEQLRDFALMMIGGGFLRVRSGVVCSWEDDPGELPTVTTRGVLTPARENPAPAMPRVLASAQADVSWVRRAVRSPRLTKEDFREDFREVQWSIKSALSLPVGCGICASLVR